MFFFINIYLFHFEHKFVIIKDPPYDTAKIFTKPTKSYIHLPKKYIKCGKGLHSFRNANFKGLFPRIFNMGQNIMCV